MHGKPRALSNLLLSAGMLAVLLLGACGGQATPVPSPTAAPTNPPAAPVEAAAPPSCTAISPQPTPGPTEQSLFPLVSETDWVKGPADAAVTIIEYSDFQCPYCAQIVPMLQRLLDENPKDVRLVFRHLPLIGSPEQPFHDKAALGAQAAEAAGKQGKFWEMHDLLFEKQGDWVGLTPADFQSYLVEQAKSLSLDVETFTADLTSKELADQAQAAWDYGNQIGMLSTPTVVLNWRVWPQSVPLTFANLDAFTRLTLLEKRQFTACPEMSIDPQKEYTARLVTEKGEIVVRLFADKAPLAVNSFVFLARNGWFDDVTFHRVLPGFVAQTGDPTGTGYGGPGYAFSNEVIPGLKFDRAGLLGMANSGPDSNGSQFFITLGAASHLDGGFTLFGEVIKGLDVAQKLTPRNPGGEQELPPGDKLLRVEITEN
jgi:cyclophilin family peptidyl-prolyl cis-trans isomerase/protein-disulfide isomerase